MKDYNQALKYEIFIKEEYACAKTLIKSAKIIFDIGGHIGLFSEWCLKLNPQVEIHYFEPFEKLVQEAKARLQASSSQIVFNPFWVAKIPWSYNFLFNPTKTMQSSQFPSFLNPAWTLASVRYENLNDYLQNQKIWSIDLMKLDIEGMEFEVLFDLQEESWEKIQALVCEVHLFSPQQEAQFPKLLSLLKAHFPSVERIPSPYSEKLWLCFCQKNP